MKRDWKTWAKAAAVRAIKTVAQSAVAMIGTAAVMAEVDWKMVISAAVLAGVISILTSVAGLPGSINNRKNRKRGTVKLTKVYLSPSNTE